MVGIATHVVLARNDITHEVKFNTPGRRIPLNVDFTFSLYLFIHLSTCLSMHVPLTICGINADHQNVQDWDFEKFPIDLKKYNPIPLDPVKDKKLSEEQKKTLVRLDVLRRGQY
jgi:hypothetical protein